MIVTVANPDPSYSLVVQTARANNPSHVLTGPNEVTPRGSIDLNLMDGEVVLVTRRQPYKPPPSEQQLEQERAAREGQDRAFAAAYGSAASKPKRKR